MQCEILEKVTSCFIQNAIKAQSTQDEKSKMAGAGATTSAMDP